MEYEMSEPAKPSYTFSNLKKCVFDALVNTHVQEY